LGGGAMNAMEKSCVEVGDEGVTTSTGRGDFSATSGRDKSRGAGISEISRL
jgi:hypothetical protein